MLSFCTSENLGYQRWILSQKSCHFQFWSAAICINNKSILHIWQVRPPTLSLRSHWSFVYQNRTVGKSGHFTNGWHNNFSLLDSTTFLPKSFSPSYSGGHVKGLWEIAVMLETPGERKCKFGHSRLARSSMKTCYLSTEAHDGVTHPLYRTHKQGLGTRVLMPLVHHLLPAPPVKCGLPTAPVMPQNLAATE